jgi:hypothetical protein
VTGVAVTRSPVVGSSLAAVTRYVTGWRLARVVVAMPRESVTPVRFQLLPLLDLMLKVTFLPIREMPGLNMTAMMGAESPTGRVTKPWMFKVSVMLLPAARPCCAAPASASAVNGVARPAESYESAGVGMSSTTAAPLGLGRSCSRVEFVSVLSLASGLHCQ